MAVVILCVFVILFLFSLRTRYSRGLRKFDGPFLASITDFWKLWYTLTSSQKQMYADIHEKYGEIVRVGPNELSFANPKAIRDIYGRGGSSQKSREYDVTAVPVEGVPMKDLFPALNESWHDRQRRVVSSAFSMTQMLEHEPVIDHNITLFIKQLRKRFVAKQGPGPTMNLMKWAEYFSLGLLCELTFGERAAFVEEGKDVNGIISGVEQMMKPIIWLWNMPNLDRLTLKNPLLLWFNRHGYLEIPNPYFPTVERMFLERREYWEKENGRPEGHETLTDVFLRMGKKTPQFDPETYSTMLMAAAGKGSAIATVSIIYYLLKNRHCYIKLQEELDTKLGDAKGPVSFATANELPYLNAVIDESMRCHQTVRLTAPRDTPKSGLYINDRWVPPGVTVSICGPVANCSKEVFGDDADIFRPERWLADKEKAQQMRNSVFIFGSGKYVCLGRHLARLEIMKVVPSLLREFDFFLVEPEKEWTLASGAFASPVDLNVKLQARH